MGWTLHLLNARGRLSGIEAELRAALAEAEARLDAVAPAVALDVVIRAMDHPMPPALRVTGASYGPGRMELGIDLTQGGAEGLRHELLKAVYHEFHHVLRWDGPGYGDRLGEALVSEGLAQVFVHEMMDCPPEPWEVMPPGVDFAALCQRAHAEFDATGYDHEAWFFGAGDLPDGTGYALGRMLVARVLAERPGQTALGMAWEAAAGFREALLRLR
ncbi:hypothetical protein C0V75_13750 [Tabrizicola sp. TH137]|uniref:DUF2268 domain-containing putative Zn-dependent protease n=1 Tax=Tabrizicola sp. TH137 TaxID=2067452 RepID=UPI000C7BFD40|nr:DUF2268 domain-containing putative Zn-dependent protease [Tabrizicola sp. TH137]PLL11959.1 hypothetical protein C0V75_13750 [Tabrizicola sp. TH137]